MRVVAGCAARPGKPDVPASQPVFDLFRLERLLRCVSAAGPGETAVVQVLDAGSRIELSKAAALNGHAAGNHKPDGAPVLLNGHRTTR
jgi:hypothetical protein